MQCIERHDLERETAQRLSHLAQTLTLLAELPARFRILPGLGHVFPDRDSRELREAVRWVLAR